MRDFNIYIYIYFFIFSRLIGEKKTHKDRFTHQRFIRTQKMNLTLIYNQIVFQENCQHEYHKSSKTHPHHCSITPFCLCSFGRELVLGISMVSFGGFRRSAKNSLRASLKGVRILEQWRLLWFFLFSCLDRGYQVL